MLTTLLLKRKKNKRRCRINVRWTPNVTGSLLKWGNTGIQGEVHVKMEAGFGDVAEAEEWLPAKHQNVESSPGSDSLSQPQKEPTLLTT